MPQRKWRIQRFQGKEDPRILKNVMSVQGKRHKQGVMDSNDFQAKHGIIPAVAPEDLETD